MSVFYFFDPIISKGITYMSPSFYAGFLPHPYTDVQNPNMYLDFCKQDFKQNDLRGLTNAFSNCKKAIHLRIDLVLNQYGLLIKNQKCDFPTKLKLIESVGLLPTLILKSINDERNLIEHEYKVPELNRVEEVIEIAELLYLATENVLSSTPIEVVVGFDTSPQLCTMRIEPKKGELIFNEIKVLNQSVLKYDKSNNIYFISVMLRGIDGNILPYFEVDDNISRKIELNYQNINNWQYIILQLYNMVKKTGSKIEGNIEDGYISTLVHIPLNESVSSSLVDFIVEGMNERLKSDSKQDK